jgi:hypothetical protein
VQDFACWCHSVQAYGIFSVINLSVMLDSRVIFAPVSVVTLKNVCTSRWLGSEWDHNLGPFNSLGVGQP